MNALHELQRHVTNDLRIFRHEYFPGRMERFPYSGHNPKRGGAFTETRFRVPSLDFFDSYLFAGNVGGERPSDYAKSVHYHNLIFQHEGIKAIAYGFDVEVIVGDDGRPSEEQVNLRRFLDTVVQNAGQFLLLHVTDPYKTHAYRYAVDRGISMSESVEISGAVNPFLFGTGGMVYADNVDGHALLDAIEGKRNVNGARIIMVGAGGVAGSIALEALNRGCCRLVILNRTESRAHGLGRRLKSYKKLDEGQVLTGGMDLLRKHAADADIVISAATENPYVDEALLRGTPENTLVADVNYGNTATAASAALRAGRDTADGGHMVYYGVERAARLAFERRLGKRINALTLRELKQIAAR